MDAAQILFLSSEAGAQALARAALLPPDRLTRLQRLRRDVSPARAVALVELLELRARARAKFPDAERLFFTPEGLEQSTGSRIATYRAQRFPAHALILDACCGVGGDAMALRHRAPVLAVDSSPAAAFCARANLALPTAPDAHAAHALCADATTLDLRRLRDQGFGSAFFDPSRRRDTQTGRQRARSGDDYLPPLGWLNALRAHFDFVGVKVSPALDDDTLQKANAPVEFISDEGECKEAVLWFDADAEPLDTGRAPFSAERYSATILRANAPPVTLRGEGADAPPLARPQSWLIEPNPAVIRAHLVPEVSWQIAGAQIDAQIAYLTAEAFHPTPFATAYRVLDWMPFHQKKLQAWLRAHRRRVTVVKRRGVPLEPDETRRALSSPALADAAPLILVLTRMQDKIIALLCDPPTN